MTDVQQQVHHLKTQIETGSQETKQYLDQLKKKVDKYDHENKLSTTASSYLKSGMDAAQSSVDELKNIGCELEEQSKSASDHTIAMAQQSLCKVKDSLNALQEKAQEYDRKFAGSQGSKMSETVGDIVNSARQRTTDAVEMASEQAMRVKEMLANAASSAKSGAQVLTGEAVKVTEKVDETLGVTPTARAAATGVTEKVRSLDKRLHVTETAAKIDAKVTGGFGTKIVQKGVEMVQESIDYMTESLQQAKIAADQSSTAQSAETQAARVGDKASAATASVRGTVSAGKEHVQDTAAQAQEKVMGMAGSARETVMGTVGMSPEGSATTQAKEKAGDVGQRAMETGGATKERAKDVAGKTKEKSSEAMSGATEKASQLKEGVKEKGSEAAGGATEKTSQVKEGAKEKGSEAMESAKETGTQVKEGVQEKGSQVTQGVKEKGSQMKHKAGQMMPQQEQQKQGTQVQKSTLESVKGTARDVMSADKEATMGMTSGDSATQARQKQEREQAQQQRQGDQGAVEQMGKSAAQASEQAK